MGDALLLVQSSILSSLIYIYITYIYTHQNFPRGTWETRYCWLSHQTCHHWYIYIYKYINPPRGTWGRVTVGSVINPVTIDLSDHWGISVIDILTDSCIAVRPIYNFIICIRFEVHFRNIQNSQRFSPIRSWSLMSSFLISFLSQVVFELNFCRRASQW